MDFIDRFHRFFEVRRLLSPAAPYLLAVSGGVDSMVMADLFRKCRMPFGIAHCNFQLRGEASDDDEAFVRETAAALEVPFYAKRFDTKAHAASHGISTQMAARDLRYAWFAEIAEQFGHPYLATAHHLNDSVETALLNFIRGTGLTGMAGMRQEVYNWTPPGLEEDGRQEPYSHEHILKSQSATGNIRLIRPLLFASRDTILEYAQTNQVAWREDSSNASDDYARNFIRHHIVPRMTELNGNFLQTAARNLARFQEAKDNLDFLTFQFLGLQYGGHGQVSPDSCTIDKQKLMQLPAPQRALREILKPRGFTEEQTRQLAENLGRVGFALQSEAGWEVLCDRTEIAVRLVSGPHAPSPTPDDDILINQDDLMVRLPDGQTLFFMATAAVPPFPDGSEAVVVNAERLRYPLVLRHWQEGDSFQPFGMGGKSQKLQDFFTNQKLSRLEKERVWLLFNGDKALIWVLGLRLDERFRISGGGQSGLKIWCHTN